MKEDESGNLKWTLDLSGKFTVNSAYSKLMAERDAKESEVVGEQSDKAMWGRVWKAKIQGNV